MHELGIVFHIMDTLEAVAKDNELQEIHSVTIEVGEVSMVVPDYLTDCWHWAVQKKELLAQCEMKLAVLPAVTLCQSCGKEYPTVAYGRICPYCGSEKTYLLRGNELNIKEIEAV